MSHKFLDDSVEEVEESAAQSITSAYSHIQWEYAHFYVSAKNDPQMIEHLNVIGADGWEIFQVTPIADGVGAVLCKRVKRG